MKELLPGLFDISDFVRSAVIGSSHNHNGAIKIEKKQEHTLSVNFSKYRFTCFEAEVTAGEIKDFEDETGFNIELHPIPEYPILLTLVAVQPVLRLRQQIALLYNNPKDSDMVLINRKRTKRIFLHKCIIRTSIPNLENYRWEVEDEDWDAYEFIFDHIYRPRHYDADWSDLVKIYDVSKKLGMEWFSTRILNSLITSLRGNHEELEGFMKLHGNRWEFVQFLLK